MKNGKHFGHYFKFNGKATLDFVVYLDETETWKTLLTFSDPCLNITFIQFPFSCFLFTTQPNLLSPKIQDGLADVY